MKLPDYSEFIDSLSPEDFDGITEYYNRSEPQKKPFACSNGLLMLYNQWLAEQLDKEN